MRDLFNYRWAKSQQPSESSVIASLAFDTPLDQLFDYRVPEELSDSLQIGQRVQAPFGRGNRAKIGFCMELTRCSADASAGSTGRKLKTITKIVDPKPLLNGELIELARWISSYYCCPLGVVLASVLPGPIKRESSLKLPKMYRLSELGRAVLKGESPARLGLRQRAILEALTGADGPKTMTRKDLLQRSSSSSQSLSSLIQKGYVQQLESSEVQSYLSQCSLESELSLVQPKWSLSCQQQQALKRLEGVLEKPSFGVHLLHGVTSSGKTEIYIRCVERVLSRGLQAIVLVPEIALTTQTLERFSSRLPGVCVLHSGLTSAQRREQWLRIASGRGRVVIGPRSAVFAPTDNLGLIVVDEEHEPSYKQDTQPRYHGRDVAIKRAQLAKVPIILGSATPSLESLHNSRSLAHYSYISLSRRIHDLPLPKVQVVDLRQEYRDRKGMHIFSRTLESCLQNTLESGQQAILLLNRRGYASFLSCPSCDYVLTCQHCDVALTYHRRTGAISTPRALCHYCLSESRVPANCPTCGQRLIKLGVGTQRAEQELSRKFPQARYARVDSDSMNRQKYQELLDNFGRGELDVLLGTQMIAKGLDFPRVHLVGILSADTSLSIPDFRSAERTFQLAAQVAGRAGRATPGARVILQTFNPDFPAIDFATTHDYDAFAEGELALRKSLGYPPFGRMARIILRAASLAKLEQQAERAGRIISQAVAGAAIKWQGPLPPPIGRISDQYRLHFVLRSANVRALHDVLTKVRGELFKLGVHVAIDADPVNLL